MIYGTSAVACMASLRESCAMHMRIWMGLALGLMVAACGARRTVVVHRSESVGGGPGPAGVSYVGGGGVAREESVTLEDGRTVVIRHAASADPTVAGCSDGTREAFHGHPSVAGCGASWQGEASLRAPRSGGACGDTLGLCGVPADACAAGWHVCGASGSVEEVRRIGAEACEHAGGGRYSAAISHCLTQEGCSYDDGPSARYECFAEGWCSEPVCCGDDCGDFGACTSGVWPDRTHIAQGTDQGCGRTSSVRAGGVLCCKD
ncbi:MAG: hypothetical protein OHK0013_35840 [Sandaracinaceae bacterium]